MIFFGKNLRHIRKQLSKTQSEVASLLKKGQTTIGNWENGISEPSLEELVILSNYFDISLDTLVKVDLSGAVEFPGNRFHTSVKYDHSAENLSIVRDGDDKLSFVLEEIKNIREEMEKIYSRLPADNT
ncbi:MAG TPA: helix-turn-helix transcriptional regulator [Puia sp.]|nr:helix-turn-helix transcriptional regulator [Puia sp.]